MDIGLIFQGKATIEDLEILNQLGYEFLIEDGKVKGVIYVDR